MCHDVLLNVGTNCVFARDFLQSLLRFGGFIMFIRGKKIKFIVISCVALLISSVLVGYCYCYILIGEKNCLSWIDENKALITYDNITTLLPIKYEMLSSDYKELFSKEEFNNANNEADIYNIYLKINSIGSQVNTKNGDIATDGYKNYLNGILHANGTKYKIQYHIFLRAKHLSFEPEITKWIIDIEEVK